MNQFLNRFADSFFDILVFIIVLVLIGGSFFGVLPILEVIANICQTYWQEIGNSICIDTLSRYRVSWTFLNYSTPFEVAWSVIGASIVIAIATVLSLPYGGSSRSLSAVASYIARFQGVVLSVLSTGYLIAVHWGLVALSPLLLLCLRFFGKQISNAGAQPKSTIKSLSESYSLITIIVAFWVALIKSDQPISEFMSILILTIALLTFLPELIKQQAKRNDNQKTTSL